MKKILSLTLVASFIFLLGMPTFADSERDVNTVIDYTVSQEGLRIEEKLNEGLTKEDGYKFEFIGIKSISDSKLNSRLTTQSETKLYGFRIARPHLDGAYINGDGVRVRTRPSLSATVKGLLYYDDIVWFDPFESDIYADGYYWLYVYTDSRSNMGQDQGYMTTNYLGRPW